MLNSVVVISSVIFIYGVLYLFTKMPRLKTNCAGVMYWLWCNIVNCNSTYLLFSIVGWI